MQRVLRNLFVPHRSGQNQGQKSQGYHLHRRPQQRLPARFARHRPRNLHLGRADPWHLLWQPADDAHAWRPCLPGARARIRQNPCTLGYGQPAVRRPAGSECMLDEPQRLYRTGGPRFPGRRPYPQLSGRGCPRPCPRALLRPVPPRGASHGERHPDPA